MTLNQIYQGDCIEVMKTWPENFVDTIITDPPYGLHFMGKSWDKFGGPLGKDHQTTRERSGSMHAGEYDLTRNPEFQTWCTKWATEALRIAKPGAFMLVSGGTRTFHRMTAGLEDAGWEIRDCLMWLYGSGFPKSLDISKAIDKAKGAEREVTGVRLSEGGRSGGTSSVGQHLIDAGKEIEVTAPATDLAKQWNGWGTALKPAWEPIIVAMKPLDGTFAENAEKWGVAGINVDGGRVATDETITNHARSSDAAISKGKYGDSKTQETHQTIGQTLGRWPANLILDEEAAGMLDGQTGELGNAYRPNRVEGSATNFKRDGWGNIGTQLGQTYEGTGGASRFFYVAKSARAERNEGCEGLPTVECQTGCGGDMPIDDDGKARDRFKKQAQNHHPTVKPLSLMKYLCLLTKMPTGGIVLDPFAGSGTTLWAAEFHNRPWIGIEMNPEYVAIANARIARERAQIKMAL